MEKLTGKGKHIVKVQNNTHENMVSKPSVVRRAQMQDTRHTFEMKRPSTSNNLVYIHIAISKPYGNHKLKNRYIYKRKRVQTQY